jgi:hypothetical protein
MGTAFSGEELGTTVGDPRTHVLSCILFTMYNGEVGGSNPPLVGSGDPEYSDTFTSH